MKPSTLTAMAFAAALATPGSAQDGPPTPVRSAVLLHGATMSASSWRPVYDILVGRGFDVTMAELPLTSLADDVEAARVVIDRQDGPIVLVGHSYGGAVASVAGTHPKVEALVYVAAFQPDIGESVASLAERWPMLAHPLDLGNGSMIVQPEHYAADLAADLPSSDAAFLAGSQKPTAFAVFTDTLPEVSWRDKPSVGIVSLQDRTIDPNLLRIMYERSGAAVVEVETSHLPQLARPDIVADAIIAAAELAAPGDAPSGSR